MNPAPLNYLQTQPEVIRVAGAEAVSVVGPRQVPVDAAVQPADIPPSL